MTIIERITDFWEKFYYRIFKKAPPSILARIDLSIAHWERMIDFACEQPRGRRASFWYMFKAIGEAWGGDDCALCEKYSDSENRCPLCPLHALYGVSIIPKSACVPGWLAVSNSITWGSWLYNAGKFLEDLHTLRVCSVFNRAEEDGR